MLNMPLMGFKTWDMFADEEKYIGLKLPVLEITSKDKHFNFRRKALEGVKDRLEDKEVSMHTQTKRIFSRDSELLEEIKLTTLRDEVLACDYIGADQLVLHLKQGKLSEEEARKIEEIVELTREKNVQVLYEPNSNFKGESYIYNLEKIDGLRANMDLCHLAMAVENETLGMGLNEFLRKVRDEVVYVHASNYDGEREHVGLDQGSLDWRHVLEELDLDRIVKVIIELHHRHFEETKQSLEKFLDK